jgi:hypothetical protein
MSDVSARLDQPFIAPSQAQKHVTHNEAVQRLDILVQMALDGFEATEPPAAPDTGARYALGQGAMGVWAGQDGQIAVFLGEAWTFVAPQEGWIATARGTADVRLYRDGTWQRFPERIARLGIATDADALNRLSVSAEATLLSHAGAGHQLKINTATAADTASLLFQTGFSGRAEMGIAGQDDLSIKVSADGANWTEALRVNAQTGRLSGAGVQSSPTDATAGRVLAVGAFGLGAVGTPANLADLDAITTPAGFHRVINTAAGTFPAGATGASLFGVMQIERYGPSDIVQTYKPITADAIHTRRYTGGAWQSWRQVYTQASLLGTVSQSGGVATGAVIERGSNANGDYVRFADGTQLCWHTLMLGAINVAEGAGFASAAAVNWTFPAGFAAGTKAAITGASTNIGRAWLSPFSSNNAACSVLGLRLLSTSSSSEFRVTALGRWF